MACFLVPGTEAVVVTAAALLLKKYEQRKTRISLKADGDHADAPASAGFSRKLFWLASLLWGGVILLAFEHLWHGEIVPWAPFLTAMSDRAATGEMLHEMATVGVAMAALTTAVWLGMLAVSAVLEKRASRQPLVPEL